jgi:hypothetical protein
LIRISVIIHVILNKFNDRMFRLDRYEEKIKNNREKIIPSELIPPQLNLIPYVISLIKADMLISGLTVVVLIQKELFFLCYS